MSRSPARASEPHTIPGIARRRRSLCVTRRRHRMTAPDPAQRGHRAPLPPRWVIRGAWLAHRAIFRLTRGRMGLRRQTPERWGMMRLKTVGRRSGIERHAILGYFEDGPNLV